MPIDLTGSSWKPAFLTILAVQTVISGTFSIVPPIIPLLLPQLGLSTADEIRIWAGLVISVTPLGAAVASPLWGRYSDRIDRRVIIFISCAGASVCTAAAVFVSEAWQLLLLRALMGLFGGHIAAGMALVTTTVPENRLGWAMGWFVTCQLGGSLLGPLVGGAIADSFNSLRAPFVCAAMAAGAIACLAYSLLKADVRTGSASHAARDQSGLHVLGKYPGLAPMIAILLLTQFVAMSAQPIISLYVAHLLDAHTDVAMLAGAAFSVAALSGLVAAPLLGAVSDRLGARRLLPLTIAGAALFTLPQAFAPGYGIFVSERFVAGMFIATLVPTVNAAIGRRIAASDRGSVFGLTASATFFGGFLGPMAGGLIAAGFGLGAVFAVSSFVMLMNLVLFRSSRPHWRAA